ncbi:ATP-dependent protease subunit HslV [Desulforegula conservatrix]|uniref:ATP-dependent protease subunit HslV n=1 Tax=Desulforegula conservatrix TaxID=153026 RepID=UPI000410C4E4|nr:ATP-dependent protease subunit HslV [Desulforegula conservatrix]
MKESFHGTTILAVMRNGRLAVAGDGQVTLGDSIIKHGARKVRRIYDGKIIVGFAGSTADAMTLSSRLEAKLEQYGGNLTRSAVELAKEWRTDKYMRRLEAMMIAAEKDKMLLLSGNGDVIEPDGGVLSIGSGAQSARSAAEALFRHTDMDARSIVEASMEIAGSICIYTNNSVTVEEF